MKRTWSPITIVCLLLAVAMAGGIAWRCIWGNPGWQIRQVFPGSVPSFEPLNSPEPSVPLFIRLVFPGYFRADEWLGIELVDSPEPIDLQERFSRLSHLKITSVYFTRCRITRLCPTQERGWPGFIHFDHCDFSALSEDERAQLRASDPTDPAMAEIFTLGDV